MHHFFYKDLNGRRRLRRFASTALAILAVLAGMALLGEARSAPQTPATQAAAAVPRTAAVEPTAVPETDPPATSVPCPVDPEAWSFVEVFPDDHYRRIEPACVYTGLARTAAWMLLERMGYSKPAAAEALAFDLVPWEPRRSLYGFTNLKGPSDLPLVSEWPAHPDFQFWQVDGEGRPALAISLRGCYRPPEGSPPVICVLALDRSPGSAVSVLGDLKFAHHGNDLPGSRTFHLVAYAGNRAWTLVGQLEGLSLELEGVDQMEAERQRVADRLGTEPWDTGWLLGSFGLAMIPLPEDWRLFSLDMAAIDAIGDELDRFIPLSLGENDE
jgi:hypothetical protein